MNRLNLRFLRHCKFSHFFEGLSALSPLENISYVLCRLSSVYWTESSTAGGSVLYRHDSRTTQMVLGRSPTAEGTRPRRSHDAGVRSRSIETGCSCPAMSLAELFAVDTTATSGSDTDAVLFVWERESGGQIWTADRQGCICRLLRGATLAQPIGGRHPFVVYLFSKAAINRT